MVQSGLKYTWLHVTFPVHTKWSRINENNPLYWQVYFDAETENALLLNFHGHGDTDQPYSYHITSYLYRKLEQ